MRFLSPLLFLTFIIHLPVRALLFYGLDNSANQTDPGAGLPFDNIARVERTNGNVNGSAVYLGNGWMLSANHVTRGFTDLRIRFDNGSSTTYNVDASSIQQVATGVDLSVFKLTSGPSGLPTVTLWDDPNTYYTGSSTLVGWGRGRGADPLLDGVVSWGTIGTSAKRWGENDVTSYNPSLSYTQSIAYDFAAIATRLGDSEGNTEAAVIDKDSGSALFQNISGTWYLMGVAVTVSQQSGPSTSSFGDPSDNNPLSDINYYAFIGEYEDEIQNLIVIPELSSLGLASLCLLTLSAVHLIRKEKKSYS